MESLNARFFVFQVIISIIAISHIVASANDGGMQPNVIVAKDGSGQYTTVTDAINSYLTNYQGRYTIYVKSGIYNEYITVDEGKQNILLYGDGPIVPLLSLISIEKIDKNIK
jgi:pectin methylesterase-like acyl-CoA thioesterase